jgi:putative Holliday junction resolvase
MSSDVPTRRGRVVGIDLGTRRIGIAVSDSARTMALPRTTLNRTGDVDADRSALVRLIVEEGATTVVVGLPLSLDGSRGRAALDAVAEAEALGSLLEAHAVDVELFDERLTTVTAHQVLAVDGTGERARRKVVDQAAAAVMLGAWLDGAGRGS